MPITPAPLPVARKHLRSHTRHVLDRAQRTDLKNAQWRQVGQVWTLVGSSITLSFYVSEYGHPFARIARKPNLAMTTLANAIHKAKKLALETQATAYVIFDPSHLDNPPDLAYYAATEEEADTFFAGCEIVDSVEPEDIVEAP